MGGYSTAGYPPPPKNFDSFPWEARLYHVMVVLPQKLSSLLNQILPWQGGDVDPKKIFHLGSLN